MKTLIGFILEQLQGVTKLKQGRRNIKTLSDSNGDSTPACRQTTSAEWTAERERAHLVYTREGERRQR